MLILYINVLNALGEEQIMSAQGAKKRMGSRRQLKHKSPDVDELQFKETTVQECGGSTESAEDVLELSKNRKKLGSRRKNNRQHHAKDLGVSDGAARNTTEDDQLGTTRMSLTDEETISDDPAMEASAGHEPKSHLDDRLHSQEKSKQTRRKMGSTRWTHKKQEDEHVHRAETSELRDNTQAGGERFEVSPDKNTVSSVELPQEEADVTSDLQRTHSNLISRTDGLTACVAGQSASDSQGVFNPTINVQGADLWDGDGNIDVNVEPSQLDGFTAPEAHTAGCLVNPSQRSPIGDAINTRSFESNLVGEESVNSITEIQQPETITSEVGGRAEDPGKVAEGGCIKHLEPADTGSDLNTAGRRRKMGSMRRNLNSGRKEEDVRQQQKVDNEQADEVSEDSVSEHSQEAAKDPRPLEPAPHPTSEEDPADQSAHQPVTSPDSDLMSGTLLSGRRRKLGSHRMSSRPPNQEAQTGGDDKLSEVDDNEMESSTNISSSTPGRHLNPVSDLGSAPRTTESPPGRRLSQDSRSSISLAGSSGDGGVNSNSYNVVMVGNSSVGKTSFMRRVQNGRFSSDLPSSVGLDTCPWPVTADGRRVVLQLWDTAGQERFHSITRQIFHKAHAFLLMYDITSSWSFTAVSYWANCIQEEAAENVTILLLGNKSDCAERQVPTQKGEILAKEYNFEFMECSVATGQNVNESLQTLARILSNKVKLGEETTVLHKEPQQKKSSGCC
ncbi:ras and EF-hand domain-containing protein homolog isoform X2 [Takifugu flavidus]|uniref:ras and EF-hand domain-containing protein homolog isoform X2 n=1 Tax=Takifugu flavidus TaxID=433684 RepID=UPI0025446AE0|nr:ras and EF-hand domain-containing protein homolog isoform X2 [Takifugu flavidus]